MKNKNREAEIFSINNLLNDIDERDTVPDSDDITTKSLDIGSMDASQYMEYEEMQKPLGEEKKDLKNKKPVLQAFSGRELEAPLAYIKDIKSGEKYSISKTKVVIGCGIMCDIRIQENSELHTISRKHAVISMIDGNFYVRDISSNGTFFCEKKDNETFYLRLPHNENVELKNGQTLRLADMDFAFEIS